MDVTDKKDLDKWLSDYEAYLKEKGYNRYVQRYKSEDFAYWKSISIDDEKAYQIGLLFYDYRKFTSDERRIGIQYECHILGDYRIDLVVSKDITLEIFEEMSEKFYNTMKKYC